MTAPPSLSVVCPCFAEERNLAELYQRVAGVCGKIGCTFELILVDDGSPDGTWDAIFRLSQNDSRVRGIRLSRNYGHQLALAAGLSSCRGERVLMIDSDLQDPPELLEEMMRLMDQGFENVYGRRISRQGTSLTKRFFYHTYYRVLSFLADCEIPRDSGDFRLISRRIVDIINAMPEHHRFIRGMISWVGFRQIAVPYHRDSRHAGRSGYTWSKLFQLAFDGITSFSIKPLRIATLLGGITGVFALIMVAYIVVATVLFGRDVPGWPSLMVAILAVGSLQLFVLGILGEYLGRLFLESKRRPLYLIQEETTPGSESDLLTVVPPEPQS
jgi:glycosyltransferase involved in cell wall biosynthesis